MKTRFIHLFCLNRWRPHTRLVNSQIPVTLMVAPACERETDIKGKKIRKKIQVTKQPQVKNTSSFHKAIFGHINTNQKYPLHTTLNFKFLLYSIVRLTSSTIKSQKTQLKLILTLFPYRHSLCSWLWLFFWRLIIRVGLLMV